MVEVLNSNESALDKEVEEAISGFKEEEKILEDDVIDDQEQEKIKQVEKLPNGKVRFPYESNDHECSLILERKGNRVFVKLEGVPTYMGNQMTNEYDDKAPNHQKKDNKEKANLLKNGANFEVTSSKDFLINLGNVLNIAISSKRISATKKGEQAYDLLFPKEK
ncbi:MAG: hypothetical protein WAZ12_05455 [Candidatus Absconditicoccaceae bacterium]